MSGIHLVTGGAGYFGTLLVDALLAEGKRVRILDIHEADLPERVEKIRADIRDASAVVAACKDVEVIHHNVALVPLAKDNEAFFSVNEGGMKNVLKAAKTCGVRKVVAMSSSAVYGVPKKNPVNDETPTVPGEEYGQAKLAAEKLCLEYANKGGDVTVIRPRTIMGHGRLGIMQILFEWVRLGRNIPVFGDGANRYQFVHADDLASACLKAAERPGSAIYNVGAEKFGTMRETLEGLITHAGTKSRVVRVPEAPAVAMMKISSRMGVSPLGAYHSLMYAKSMYFDLTRTKHELDWTPRFSNVEMFADSYDWYLAHREEVMLRKNASHHRSPVRQGVLRAVSWALSLARD